MHQIQPTAFSHFLALHACVMNAANTNFHITTCILLHVSTRMHRPKEQYKFTVSSTRHSIRHHMPRPARLRLSPQALLLADRSLPTYQHVSRRCARLAAFTRQCTCCCWALALLHPLQQLNTFPPCINSWWRSQIEALHSSPRARGRP